MRDEVSVLRSNLLKLVGELIGVYCENHEKRKNNYESSTCMFLVLQIIVNIISSGTKWLNVEFDNTLFLMSAHRGKNLLQR